MGKESFIIVTSTETGGLDWHSHHDDFDKAEQALDTYLADTERKPEIAFIIRAEAIRHNA